MRVEQEEKRKTLAAETQQVPVPGPTGTTEVRRLACATGEWRVYVQGQEGYRS